MSAITATHTPTTTPKRSFRRRYSVARGNAYQAWGVFSGSALLALATQLRTSPVSTAVMIAGFVTVYLNCHAIAHYLAGRAVGLRFRGYGVRGTDHPEVYPPGIRQLMQAAPFYVALSTKSKPRAGQPARAKAIYYAAGETSTAICSIAYAAIAAAAHIPGGQSAPRRDDHLQRDLHHRHYPQPHRRLRQGPPSAPQLTAFNVHPEGLRACPEPRFLAVQAPSSGCHAEPSSPGLAACTVSTVRLIRESLRVAGERSRAGERAEEVGHSVVHEAACRVVGIDDHLADGVDGEPVVGQCGPVGWRRRVRRARGRCGGFGGREIRRGRRRRPGPWPPSAR